MESHDGRHPRPVFNKLKSHAGEKGTVDYMLSIYYYYGFAFPLKTFNLHLQLALKFFL